MTTLASCLLDLARKCTSVVESTATGGSTTTLVDSAMSGIAARHFKDGTIFFLSGNNAGKTAVVSEFLEGTFTFPTQTGACAAGNQYAGCPPDFPKWRLVAALNEAMKDLIPPDLDISLTTVADQEAYTLPAGVANVLRVEVAANTAAPYDYETHRHWDEMDGTIRFKTGYAPDETGYIIRLTYPPQWTEIFTDAGVIPNVIDRELLSWKAAVYALRWRINKTREDEPERVRQLNEALAMAERYMGMHPIPERAKDASMGTW